MRRVVSEKTLELNITAELLGMYRGMPSFRHVFWLGMKQEQEKNTGIDECLNNAPRGGFAAFQFKAPRRNPQNGYPFYFSINTEQHQNLSGVASQYRDSFFYVFPHYNSFTKLKDDSPFLLTDTWFVRVNDLPVFPPIPHTHRVLFEMRNRRSNNEWFAQIHSDRVRVKTFNGYMLKDILSSPEVKSGLLGGEVLKKWFAKTKDNYNSRKCG